MNFKTTLVLLLILAAVAVYLKFFGLKHDPVPVNETDSSFLVPEAHTMKAMNFGLTRKKGAKRNIFSSVVVAKSRVGWRLLNPFHFVLKEKVVEDYLISGLREIEIVDRFTSGDSSYPGLKDAELEDPAAVLTFRLLSQDDKHERQMQLHLGRALTAGRYYARLIAGMDEDEDIYVIRGSLPDQLVDMDVESWLQKQLGSPKMSAVKGLRVEISKKDESSKTLSMTRQSTGEWHLIDKSSVKGVGRGSEAAIADYLTKLGSLSTIGFQVVDQPEKLADFGLDNPMIKVAISASAGSAHVMKNAYQLNIGSKDLSGKAYYANWIVGAPTSPTAEVDEKTEGMLNQTIYPQAQVVMRISALAVEGLLIEEDVFRDRRVLTMKDSDLKSISVNRKGIGKDFAYSMSRADNRWQFDSGLKTPFEIDSREIASFIGQLLGLTAESFDHEGIQALAALPADKRPYVELAITDYLGKKSLLKFSPMFDLSARLNTHARKWLVQSPMDPTNYVIGESQLQRLLLPPLALKQRQAMELGLDKVTRVVLKRGDGSVFDFEKKAGAKGGWKLNGYKYYDPKQLDNLLRQVQSLRVAQWLPAENKGDKESDVKSELHIHTTSGVIELNVNALNGLGSIGWGEKLIAPTDQGVMLNVGSFKAAPQLIGLLRDEYRLKPLLGASSDKVQQVALALGQDTVHIQRSQRGVFSSPQLKGMDQKAAARLFDLAAGLSVIRYVDLDKQLQSKLLSEQVQTQLRIQLVDGRVVTLDIIGKASKLMAAYPEMKPFAGIKSWVLTRVLGRIPLTASKETESADTDVLVTWCLLPDASLNQLLGMNQ